MRTSERIRECSQLPDGKRHLAVAIPSVNLRKIDPKQARGRSIAGKGREAAGGAEAISYVRPLNSGPHILIFRRRPSCRACMRVRIWRCQDGGAELNEKSTARQSSEARELSSIELEET